jgi:hypothetical protein
MYRAHTISSRLAAGIGGTALLVLALAGCGETDGPAKTGAAPASEKPVASVVSDSDLSAARDAYDLKVAECLRGKGFKVKDPQPGEGITETLPGINKAGSECMATIGDPPTVAVTKEGDAEQLKIALGWADCLRGLGYQVEEPKSQQAFIMPQDATTKDIEKCTK